MTFKHVKFEDSITMRSLERVAREKGWINQTPLHKIASMEKTDLSVSLNFTENIIKLCEGLKSNGLDNYASELENKFINYKKAKTDLYNTCKEDGEDLINDAHPKGSHKLEGVEGDCTVETIIDQHLALLKMIDKKPTGKLSSRQIVDQVKLALGNEDFLVKKAAPTSDQVAAFSLILDQSASMLNNIAKKIETAPKDQIGFTWSNPNVIASNLKRWANILTGAVKSGVASGDTKALWGALENIKNQKDDVQVFNDENKDANRMAVGMLNNVVNKLEQISWSIQHPDYTPPVQSYKGSTFSKAEPGHHWEAKYVMPEEKAVQTTGNYLDINLGDLRNSLSWYASQIQKNVLDKEESIYEPIPDSNLSKISILDQAFDRAENFRNQLNNLSASLKGKVVGGSERITGTELSQVTGKFPMFKRRVFNSKEDIIGYVDKIKQSIYNAIGIK